MFFGVFVVWICLWSAAWAGKRCYMEMLPPGGIIVYPLQRSQAAGKSPGGWWGEPGLRKCMMYMRVEKQNQLKLVFRNIQLENNTLWVSAAKEQRLSSWERLATIKGSHTEVVVKTTNITGVRLKLKKNVGRFFVFYQELYCQEPNTVMAEKRNCSNSYYESSVCYFSCRAPNYLPVRPNIDAFSTECREDRTWSKDMTTECVTKDQLLKECLLDEDTFCNYTAEELADLVDEDNEIPLQHEEFAALRMRAMVLLGIETPDEGQNPEDGESFNQCYVHCLTSITNNLHLFKCKSLQLESKERKDCLRCRHTRPGCFKYLLYV